MFDIECLYILYLFFFILGFLYGILVYRNFLRLKFVFGVGYVLEGDLFNLGNEYLFVVYKCVSLFSWFN